MTTDEIKQLAKEQYGKEISDRQACVLLEKLEATAVCGELSDDDLENVSGGGRIISVLKDILGNLRKF